MKSAAFIHNDDVKYFHVAVRRTHKLVVMGHINFEDHALIERQWVGKKMNATRGMFKDEKEQGNCRKQFAFVVGRKWPWILILLFRMVSWWS